MNRVSRPAAWRSGRSRRTRRPLQSGQPARRCWRGSAHSVEQIAQRVAELLADRKAPGNPSTPADAILIDAAELARRCSYVKSGSHFAKFYVGAAFAFGF